MTHSSRFEYLTQIGTFTRPHTTRVEKLIAIVTIDEKDSQLLFVAIGERRWNVIVEVRVLAKIKALGFPDLMSKLELDRTCLVNDAD